MWSGDKRDAEIIRLRAEVDELRRHLAARGWVDPVMDAVEYIRGTMNLGTCISDIPQALHRVASALEALRTQLGVPSVRGGADGDA
jgi:hypothetical protein